MELGGLLSGEQRIARLHAVHRFRDPLPGQMGHHADLRIEVLARLSAKLRELRIVEPVAGGGLIDARLLSSGGDAYHVSRQYHRQLLLAGVAAVGRH